MAIPADEQVMATISRISVPYNRELASLEEVLKGVQRPGDFFVQSLAEIPMPRIEVDGVGVLSFPVSPAQIQRLIQQATRAPYGRGEETLLDEAVRKVWQLPSEKVHIGGRSWEKSWQDIVARVTKGLGCRDAEVFAEFYKLLIYDTGGFFTAHRDTEKANGMFGTLIIVLPSAHRGGELIIRHAGREVTMDMTGAKTSVLAFAAFYADCEHEVRPITEGDRVCLVYNLIQPRRGKKSQVLSAPLYNVEVQTVAERFAEAFAEDDKAAKLVWLLEHQYSSAELSFAALKNADAARARVILAAAERADCAVHLGIVHLRESGLAVPACRPSRHGGRSADGFRMIQVRHILQYIDDWVDTENRRPLWARPMLLQDDEVLPAGALDNEKPDKQRFVEATGNEGASFERSYHRAALVIWRRVHSRGEVLFDEWRHPCL